ncbi:MAG: hypothetical protein A2081_04265 [Elusimicrobia bacterium GWC2_61_19]|nr:MAG: hypothetical protein A2081_04265 [Elusimicrobia bacterium GWC2_61_19]
MKKIFLCLTALLVLTALRATAATLAVYHTSDVHGWYSARPALWDNANSTRSIGGFPALSALLKKETTPYILLDSGDMFQGTPEGILTKGLASVILMNQLRYAAAVPGNHDYDYSEARLQAMAVHAAFPLLAANIYVKKTGATPAYLKPYTIVEKDGKRLAVLGLAGKHTAASTLPENVKHLDFRDEAAEAARWLPVIKKDNPDAVIVLAHLGLSEDLSLKRVDISTWTFNPAPPGTLAVARAAQGINLVLGGHNHTAFLNGYHDPVSGAWLGESGYGLSYVTRAEMTFDDATGKLTGMDVKLIPLWTDQTGEDPVVLNMLSGFNADVEAAMGKVIGSAAADLKFSPDGLDSGIGGWLCDITRQAAGADMAFHNTKALRAEIKNGPVRLRDLYQAMPFDNTIVTMRLNGAQIKKLMADNLRPDMSYIQVSGLEVGFKRGPGGKPVDIQLKRNGLPVGPKEVFLVATNNYLAGGGTGGDVFARGKDIKDTLVQVRDVMIKAFEAGPVTAPKTGRIVLTRSPK